MEGKCRPLDLNNASLGPLIELSAAYTGES